jgi:hypothetical protein
MSKQHIVSRDAGDGTLNRLSTISVYIISIVLTGLVMIFAPAVHAQTSLLQYLTATPVPYTPGATISPGITTYNLPGYGMVRVTLSNTLPSNTVWTCPSLLQNQMAGFFYWNTACDINPFTSTAVTYTVKFEFIQPTVPRSVTVPYISPDPTSLALVVDGLGSPNTTATVSQSGFLAGEYQQGPYTSPNCSPCYTSPTKISAAGTELYSNYPTCNLPSNAPAGSGCDFANTGWALFQTTNPISLVSKIPTLTVTFNQQGGDGIGFTLGYGPQPNPCCPPWNQDSMLAQVALSQPGNSLSPISYHFLNQEPVGQGSTAPGDAQMQAYIDYLHSLNPSITSVVLDWRIYDYGPSTPPGTGPTTTRVQIGSDVYTEWSCTGCSSINNTGILGGNGKLTNGQTPPVLLNTSGGLPINRWYGIYTGIYLNNGIQFWDASCNITLDYFTVVATDPPSNNPNQIPVHVIKSGGTTMSGITLPATGRVMMLPRLRVGQ